MPVLPVCEDLPEGQQMRRARRTPLLGAGILPLAGGLDNELGRLPVCGPLRQEGVSFLLGVEADPRLLASHDVAEHGVRPAPLPLNRPGPRGRRGRSAEVRIRSSYSGSLLAAGTDAPRGRGSDRGLVARLTARLALLTNHV